MHSRNHVPLPVARSNRREAKAVRQGLQRTRRVGAAQCGLCLAIGSGSITGRRLVSTTLPIEPQGNMSAVLIHRDCGGEISVYDIGEATDTLGQSLPNTQGDDATHQRPDGQPLRVRLRGAGSGPLVSDEDFGP
jgi:hypothetical protein